MRNLNVLEVGFALFISVVIFSAFGSGCGVFRNSGSIESIANAVCSAACDGSGSTAIVDCNTICESIDASIADPCMAACDVASVAGTIECNDICVGAFTNAMSKMPVE